MSLTEGRGSRGIPTTDVRLAAIHSDADIVELFGPENGTHYKRLVGECLRDKGLLDNDTLPLFIFPPNQHQNSKMLYIADYDIVRSDGNHRVLVSVVRPFARSSTHRHEFPEDHYVIIGPVKIGTTMVLNGHHRVPVGEYHQVSGQTNSSLMVIVMRGAASIPRDQQHLT